jgi:hypothetical protein
MAIAYPRTPSARSIWSLDAAIVLWAAVWIVVGVVVYHEVRGLAQLGDTLDTASEAIDETGRALGGLRNLPFVGPELGALADRASATAASARASAQESRDRAQRLGVILGVSIAVAPTAPLVLLYLPMRVTRVREVRAVRRALGPRGHPRAFEELLAWRAMHNLPYHRLRSASPHPRLDLETGRYDRLARAELARLGIGLRERAAARRADPEEPGPHDRGAVIPSSRPHGG